MNARLLSIAAILIFVPLSLSAQQPRHLNSPLTITAGDYGALILPTMLSVSDLNDRVAVTYEPDPAVIDVEIFGRWTTVEGARETVGRYWNFIQQVHIPYMQRRFGVSLGSMQYRIVYYDRTARGGPRPIIQFVNGQFVVP